MGADGGWIPARFPIDAITMCFHFPILPYFWETDSPNGHFRRSEFLAETAFRRASTVAGFRPDFAHVNYEGAHFPFLRFTLLPGN